METAIVQRLYAYNEWANRKVWACIAALTEEQFTQSYDPALSTLRQQCIHVMGVEHWWLHFLRTGEMDFIEDEADYPDRDAIWTRWQAVMATNRDYLASLTPEEMVRRVRPDFWPEEEGAILLWEALLQVANHSTDHRAHLMAGLARLDAPTVGQDILEYILEEQLNS